VQIRGTVERLSSDAVGAIGVDGCGAPLFAVSTAGVARAFLALATATPRTPEERVATAMRAHPDLVGGPGRSVTRLMSGVPGLVAKDGAEGAFAAAHPEHGAVAVKVADGASRAVVPALVAALRLLGLDGVVLDELAAVPVLGGGQPVGAVRAAGALNAAQS
jgi:L-asparaginase II